MVLTVNAEVGRGWVCMGLTGMADRLPREVGASSACFGAGCGIDGEPKDLSRAPRQHTGAGVDLVGRLFYLTDQLSDMNDRHVQLSARLPNLDDRRFLSGDQVAASADRQISCAGHVRDLDDHCPEYDDHVPVSGDRQFPSADYVAESADHVPASVDHVFS